MDRIPAAPSSQRLLEHRRHPQAAYISGQPGHRLRVRQRRPGQDPGHSKATNYGYLPQIATDTDGSGALIADYHADPSGNCPTCIGAGIGAVVSGGVYAFQYQDDFDWGDFAVATGKGAVEEHGRSRISMDAGLVISAAHLKSIRNIFKLSLADVKPLVNKMRSEGFWVTYVESEYLVAQLKSAGLHMTFEHG
ncbi:hypothetical protein [Streptomyces ortus]|uniref:Tox-PL domain-containing protein n=1 Tax=Streptomyces ortus TaxID=2867268 RepID=A0ABT3V1M4_9ACTN|nr:hypothetical protein [Streptomyces ortus]MCX4233471.1 hypothetical protein [Streptomyces ortus]